MPGHVRGGGGRERVRPAGAAAAVGGVVVVGASVGTGVCFSTAVATRWAEACSLAVTPFFSMGRKPAGSSPFPVPAFWPSLVEIRMNWATLAASSSGRLAVFAAV